MSEYSLFIDESGHDGKHAPHAVFGAIVVKTSDISKLEIEIKKLYSFCYGYPYDFSHELKGSDIFGKSKFENFHSHRLFNHKNRIFYAGRFKAFKKEIKHNEFKAYSEANFLFVENLVGLLLKADIFIISALLKSEKLNIPKHHKKRSLFRLEKKLFHECFNLTTNTESINFIVDVNEPKYDLIKTYNFNRLISKSKILQEKKLKLSFKTIESHHNLLIQVIDIIIYIINYGYQLQNKRHDNKPLDKFDKAKFKLLRNFYSVLKEKIIVFEALK